MARIRSIHPEFCTDETLSLLSAHAERTFVRLWPHLDDEGRARDDARLLKAALYPLHDEMTAALVEHDLAELASHGLIVRYEIEGKRYLTAKPDAWKNWQKPRHPTPSKYPPPPEAYGEPPQADRDAPETYVDPPAGVVVGEGVGEHPPTPHESAEGPPQSEAQRLVDVFTAACKILAEREANGFGGTINSRPNWVRARAKSLAKDHGAEADRVLREWPDTTAEALARYLLGEKSAVGDRIFLPGTGWIKKAS